MNITIFSDDLKLKTNIESYTSDIVIHQTNNNSTFFQDILFTKPNLLIIDTDENNITKLLQKIKDENQLENTQILFLLDNFNMKFFQKLGFNTGDIDYIKKPVEINQLISKMNNYNNLFKIKNKFTNVDNFINQYSQSFIKGEMFGIVSHQWKQPLNIIATSIINIELKSELEELKHSDIENCVEKIHSTLDKITNMIHDFENIFEKNQLKSDININEAFMKSVNLMSPQLHSHKIKITNIISKTIHSTSNFENELCQSILCLLSILKDSIIKKHTENPKFNGNIKLQITPQDDKISLKIINKNIEMSKELFKTSLSLSSLFVSSSNSNNTKLYIAKNIIENKLNGNLSIVNDTRDVTFTITI